MENTRILYKCLTQVYCTCIIVFEVIAYDVFRFSNIFQFITCRNKNNNTADNLSYFGNNIFLLVEKIF